MIRGKEIIDAKFKAEGDAHIAKLNAYLESAKELIPQAEMLCKNEFIDLYDTLLYIQSLDESKSDRVWNKLRNEVEEYGIDYANAWRKFNRNELAINSTRIVDGKRRLYMTAHGLYLGYDDKAESLSDYLEHADLEYSGELFDALTALVTKFPPFADVMFKYMVEV